MTEEELKLAERVIGYWHEPKGRADFYEMWVEDAVISLEKAVAEIRKSRPVENKE